MKNRLFIPVTAVLIGFYTLSFTASAENSCAKESDGRVTLTGSMQNNVQICRNVPLEAARYTMYRFGFCNGEPNKGDGYSNCHSLIDSALEVTFSAGSLQSFAAKLPPAGSYSHYFAIFNHIYEFAAIVELANNSDTVAANGIFTTPYEEGELPDCSDGCTGVHEPQQEPTPFTLDSGSIRTPSSRPGAVPLALFEGDNIAADANNLVHTLITPVETVTLMNYKFQTWNSPMDSDDRHDVAYIVMTQPLSEPFIVSGDEEGINVDFDLSQGATFTYYLDQNGLWNVRNIVLSNSAMTPRISYPE